MSEQRRTDALLPGHDEGAIFHRLASLRRAVRSYITLDGLAWTAATLGLLFWLSLGLDWALELPTWARQAVCAAAGIVFIAVVWRRLLGRLMTPIPLRAMATAIERRDSTLHGELLSFVELAPRRSKLANSASELVTETGRRAAARLAQSTGISILRWRDLGRRLMVGSLSLGTVVAFAWAAPAIWETWLARMTRWEDRPWPRWTSLEIVGFENGSVKVAKGDDFELLVRADAAKVIPEVVQVRYQASDGARGRENLSRQGRAIPGRDPFQEYTHRFLGLLNSMKLEIRGGDARLRDLTIEVVDSPAVIGMSVDCEYPSYTGLAMARDLTATRTMRFPKGSRITLHGKTNKDLVRVEIGSGSGEASGAPEILDGAAVAHREFVHVVDSLREDRELEFRLTDTDGIRGRTAMAMFLAAEPDRPPLVLAQIQGIGTAVTARARIPFAGRVEDDYGIAATWIEYEIRAEAPTEAAPAEGAMTQPIAIRPDGRLEDAALDLQPLELAAGGKLLLGVRAKDNCGVGTANVGDGQRYTLDLVTPDRLRVLLEARELSLKGRLETIVEELQLSRDSLDRVQVAIPTDVGATSAGFAPSDPLSTSRIRVDRARQNADRSVQEVMELAAAFDDIRDQLINNRLEVEGWNTRIQEQIAEPLKSAVDQLFPPYQSSLVELQKALAANQFGIEPLDQARHRADLILNHLRGILEKMLELESLHELMDTLREIIDAQDALRKATEERRRKGELDLLKE